MTSPQYDPLDSRSRATLGVIRLALLAGVLAFGAVTWFSHRGAGYQGPAAPTDGLLGNLSYFLDVASIGGALVIRRLAFATADAGRYRSYCIIGWAMGEGAALMGGAYYFMTNDMSRYVTGVLVMLFTFVLLPLRRT